MENGDKLIIKDFISDIQYDSNIDYTVVIFERKEENKKDHQDFYFNKDITNLYKVGDEINI